MAGSIRTAPLAKTADFNALKRNRPVVVISGGHGYRGDSGTVVNGVREDKAVEAPMIALAQSFVAKGYDVIITRGNDIPDRDAQLASRPSVAKSVNAALFIEIHGDSAPSGRSLLHIYTNPEEGKTRFDKDGTLVTEQPSGALADTMVDRLKSPERLGERADHQGVDIAHKVASHRVTNPSFLGPNTKAMLIEYGNLYSKTDVNRFNSTAAAEAFAHGVSATADFQIRKETKTPPYTSPGKIFVHHSEANGKSPLIHTEIDADGKIITPAQREQALVAKTHELYAKINKALEGSDQGNLLKLDKEAIKKGEFPEVKKLITELQTHLNTLGFKAGKPDGIPGNNTKGAVANFELTHPKPAPALTLPEGNDVVQTPPPPEPPKAPQRVIPRKSDPKLIEIRF